MFRKLFLFHIARHLGHLGLSPESGANRHTFKAVLRPEVLWTLRHVHQTVHVVAPHYVDHGAIRRGAECACPNISECFQLARAVVPEALVVEDVVVPPNQPGG